MDVRIFKGNEAGYLRWIATQPQGWVLNVPTSESADLVMHRSTCWTIGNGKNGNWTGPNYFKVVSLESKALVAWAKGNSIARLRVCGHCAKSDLRPPIQRPPAVRDTSTRRAAPPGVAAATLPVAETGQPWTLWSMGAPLAVLGSIDPQIASWDHKEHPNQVRLQAYLKQVKAHFASVLAQHEGLALSLMIDLKQKGRLLRGNDVENYLTPLVNALGGRRFLYAEAEKRVGGGSHIVVSTAVRRRFMPDGSAWSGRLSGSVIAAAGKRAVRQALLGRSETALLPGPAMVHMAWRVRASTNWVGLWKPTGDAMGPVIGEPRYPEKEFHPDDDRITKLAVHRCIDESLPLGVIDIGIWWASA